MKIHDHEQGTPEWYSCRLSIPTASKADKLITSKTCKPAKIEAYAAQLAGEYLTNKEIESFSGTWATERGNELEPVARSLFEFDHDCTVDQVGFCTDESGTFGGSPDGLMFGSGLEIKCPLAEKFLQIAIEIAETGQPPAEYHPQCQMLMLVTGRTSWCFMAYHPDFKPAYSIISQNEDQQKIIRSQVNAVIARRNAIIRALGGTVVDTNQQEAA